MKFITSEESMGVLFLYIHLPFAYNDNTEDSLKAALVNKLPDHILDAIEDFAFDEGEEEQSIEVSLASNDMDTIQSLAKEMETIVSDYVEQCGENGSSGDDLMDKFDKILKGG